MLLCSCVLVDDRAAALLPCCKQDATVAALVVDIFKAVDQVGYAAKTQTCAEDEGPDTMREIWSAVDRNRGRKGVIMQYTYCVVLPALYSTLVKAR